MKYLKLVLKALVSDEIHFYPLSAEAGVEIEKYAANVCIKNTADGKCLALRWGRSSKHGLFLYYNSYSCFTVKDLTNPIFQKHWRIHVPT